MILGEDQLRVMGAPDELRDFFDELSGLRAQVIIDFGVARGDGDAHSAFPFAFGDCLLEVRQRGARSRVP